MERDACLPLGFRTGLTCNLFYVQRLLVHGQCQSILTVNITQKEDSFVYCIQRYLNVLIFCCF